MFTKYEDFRECTGWQRPTSEHGCTPVEILPRVWTAHYQDIDSQAKLASAVKGRVHLVVNTAPCQCHTPPGFWGPGVRVIEVPLEDDPDERKAFDQGKPATSNCREAGLALAVRTAGDAKQHFSAVSLEIEATLAADPSANVVVHCHASLSGSAGASRTFAFRTPTALLTARVSVCSLPAGAPHAHARRDATRSGQVHEAQVRHRASIPGHCCAD